MTHISEAITLANRIVGHFANGSVSVHPEMENAQVLRSLIFPNVAEVRGHLNLSFQDIKTTCEAECSLSVYSRWRWKSPTLRCRERWIRRQANAQLDVNWHIIYDGSLCYVLNQEWADTVAGIEQELGTDAAITAAAFFCVNNTRWLLYHHLEGYRRNLTEWPGNWPQRPHYEEGLRQYEAEQRNAKHNSK